MQMDSLTVKALKHAKICGHLNSMYQRKNADYNDAFAKSFSKRGLSQTVMRLEDKINRLSALSENTAQVADESVEDTLMDIANYAIMTMIELGVVRDEDIDIRCKMAEQK